MLRSPRFSDCGGSLCDIYIWLLLVSSGKGRAAAPGPKFGTGKLKNKSRRASDKIQAAAREGQGAGHGRPLRPQMAMVSESSKFEKIFVRSPVPYVYIGSMSFPPVMKLLQIYFGPARGSAARAIA